ncbi:M24 family metallopeptidase [Sphingomonas panacisoli]|nr:M24 family metallopeptidase [Sphingomonas panacisoli]
MTTDRRAELHAAEGKALALLDMIEARGLVAAGRTEREVEQDIYAFALAEFGVEKHWHKRIVRAGANGLATARDNPPVLTIADDDLVYLDLGPVFEEWEADVGRSYVVGDDPDKHRLVADLSTQFDAVKARFDSDPDVTGADLYAFACDNAAAAGWRFGGVIAGHIVGEFPHAHLPGEKDFYRINPENPGRLRDPDPLGQERFWILEIHLVDPAGRYGGFYERLMS